MYSRNLRSTAERKRRSNESDKRSQTDGSSKYGSEPDSVEDSVVVNEGTSKSLHNTATSKTKRSKMEEDSDSRSRDDDYMDESCVPDQSTSTSRYKPVLVTNFESLPMEMKTLIASFVSPDDVNSYRQVDHSCNESFKNCNGYWQQTFLNAANEIKLKNITLTKVELDLATSNGIMADKKGRILSRQETEEIYKCEFLKRHKVSAALHRVQASGTEDPFEESKNDGSIYGALKMVVCRNTMYVIDAKKDMHSMNLKDNMPSRQAQPPPSMYTLFTPEGLPSQTVQVRPIGLINNQQVSTGNEFVNNYRHSSFRRSNFRPIFNHRGEMNEEMRVPKHWELDEKFRGVVDAATDTRRDPDTRKYLYVLSQSQSLRDLYDNWMDPGHFYHFTIWDPKHSTYNATKVEINKKTWAEDGYPMAGDRIDVYDETEDGRRIFNMSFDMDMRFTQIRLSRSDENADSIYRARDPSAHPETKKRLLTVLSTAGRLFTLSVDERHLGNLDWGGLQVTLRSMTNEMHGEIVCIVAGVSILACINDVGQLFVGCQSKSDLVSLFGQDRANTYLRHTNDVRVPVPIYTAEISCEDAIKKHILEWPPPNPPFSRTSAILMPGSCRIISVSVGDRHMAFLDEHNRCFVLGKNQHGQLGTGNRKDCNVPTEVLHDKFIRFVSCGINHTIVCIETRNKFNVLEEVELWGCGSCGEGRLPGRSHTDADVFAKLDIKGLPRNVRQLESVKGMLFSLSMYGLEKEFEQIFSTFKFDEIASMSDESLQDMPVAVMFQKLKKNEGQLYDKFFQQQQLRILEELMRRVAQGQTDGIAAGKAMHSTLTRIRYYNRDQQVTPTENKANDGPTAVVQESKKTPRAGHDDDGDAVMP